MGSHIAVPQLAINELRGRREGGCERAVYDRLEATREEPDRQDSRVHGNLAHCRRCRDLAVRARSMVVDHRAAGRVPVVYGPGVLGRVRRVWGRAWPGPSKLSRECEHACGDATSIWVRAYHVLFGALCQLTREWQERAD